MKPNFTLRKTSDQELISNFESQVRRLDGAIERFQEKYEIHELHAIAACLRSLICSSGKGNNLLIRVIDRLNESGKNIKYPRSRILPQVTTNNRGNFAIGAKPVTGKGSATFETVNITSLMQKQCLMIRRGEKQLVLSWEELLYNYASKSGAIHSDDEVPVDFDYANEYKIGFEQVSTINDLVLDIAIYTSHNSRKILKAGGSDYVPPAHKQRPAQVGSMNLDDNFIEASQGWALRQ